MKESVSEPGRADTSDPNVKYFMDINPGWVKGHLLLTLSLITMRDNVRIFCRIIRKAMKSKRGSAKYKSKRRNTFQFELYDTLSKKILRDFDLNEDNGLTLHEDDSMADLDAIFS